MKWCCKNAILEFRQLKQLSSSRFKSSNEDWILLDELLWNVSSFLLFFLSFFLVIHRCTSFSLESSNHFHVAKLLFYFFFPLHYIVHNKSSSLNEECMKCNNLWKNGMNSMIVTVTEDVTWRQIDVVDDPSSHDDYIRWNRTYDLFGKNCMVKRMKVRKREEKEEMESWEEIIKFLVLWLHVSE